MTDPFDLADLQALLFEECETTGWDPNKVNSFGDEIAHLTEELGEAFKAYRIRHDFEVYYDENGKPQGVPIEFADIVIGLFYNAELHGFNLGKAIKIKHEFNLTRNYQHEGRTAHV